MSAITSADVTYAQVPGTAFSCPSDPRHEGVYKLDFGGGGAEYPAGGIPLLKSKLGCPNKLESLLIENMNSASGHVIKFDHVNQKLRMYQVPVVADEAPAAPLAEVATAAAVAATTVTVKVKGW